MNERALANKPVRCQSTDVYLDLGLLGEDRMVEVWYSYSPEESATRDEPGCPEEWDIHGVWLDANGVLVDIQPCIHDIDELVENLKACL
jgi:hypothetical protein